MASLCCDCPNRPGGGGAGKSSLPLICLVPRDDARAGKQFGPSGAPRPVSTSSGGAQNDFQLLDENYIKKHFNLPARALYLDPFRRPLITFPMSQENTPHFNLARKYKVNQQILDGFLDGSEAISAPSVFPYAESNTKPGETARDDEEIIYILQLPDWEYKCPVHNQTVKTPRLIALKMADNALLKKLADVPLAKPGFDALGMSAPFIVQMNPEGKWENKRPADMDEDRLKAIIQHLVNSQAISAAQSYCCQCAAESKLPKSTPQYVPVVMMPIYSADQCPFDMNCEVQKIKDAEKVKPSKKKQAETKDEKEDEKSKKAKKRGYQLQRLTDFDLLSQW